MIMAFIIPILLFLVAWLIGALVNYLADQLPVFDRLSRPVCTHCNAQLPWGAYILLEKCKNCENNRSSRSVIFQVACAILALFLWFYPFQRIPFLLVYVLVVYLGLVAVIDLEHRLVLLSVILPGIGIGLVAGWFLHGFVPTLLGGIAGTTIMYGLYWFGRLFSRYMAKRRGEEVDEEALGFGDVYVSLILGLILGWPGIIAGLFLGILIGGVISAIFLLVMVLQKRYQPLTALPYAPFLIAAALLLLFRPL
jgi:leader peptidase (prepilin peptidase) / N-methyltransferase